MQLIYQHNDMQLIYQNNDVQSIHVLVFPLTIHPLTIDKFIHASKISMIFSDLTFTVDSKQKKTSLYLTSHFILIKN